jgi:predicted O-methyltransferase YrrM
LAEDATRAVSAPENDPAATDADLAATEQAEIEALGDPRKMSPSNVERLVTRFGKLKARAHRATEERLRVSEQYEALRRSYYLSGVGQKVDVSTLPDFSTIAATVIDEGKTGMNFDRLYTLWQAVTRAPEGYPVIEVGSYKGGSAKFLAGALEVSQASPRLYVCDTFQGHARVDPEIDGANAAKGFTATSAEAVAEYLAGYPFVELVVGDIVETSARLTAPAYGFVHIDVDVYPATAFCLDFFSQRLAPGAWMVVDDYGVVTCPGAQKAADDFVRDHSDFSKVHLLTGQALVFRAG